MKTVRDDHRRLRETIRLIYLLRPDLLREAGSELEIRTKRGEALRHKKEFFS
jgi:hypothetical protein